MMVHRLRTPCSLADSFLRRQIATISFRETKIPQPRLSECFAQRNAAPFTMNTKLDYRSPEGAIDGLPKAQELLRDADASPTQMRDESGHDINTFDTGITAWMQVLGAFFLWFNTWCVRAKSNFL
jgi:hypothetical protein